MLTPETIIFGSGEVAGSQLADWSRETSREKVILPVCCEESVKCYCSYYVVLITLCTAYSYSRMSK